MINQSDYKDKIFLVTGGSGFIGTHTCKKLIGYGAVVHSVSRQNRAGDNRINWWLGDLADIKFVCELFQKIRPDFIIHLASEVTGRREIEYVIPTLNGNLISAVNLLICTTEYKSTRLVLAGSLEEADETISTPTPCSPYAAAKWASSAYARMFYELYDTPVVIARLFMVYGPMQKDLRKFIPYISLSLIRKDIPQLANGSREVDWIYIDDAVNGLLTMVTTPGIENQTIDLGTGILHTTGHVAKQLCKISQQNIIPNFGSIPERKMEQIKKANISKSLTLLNWQAKVKLDDGLRKTYEWYKEQCVIGNIDPNM